MQADETPMSDSTGDVIPIRETREIDGQLRIHYYGYWIKAYPPLPDTLQTKKALIDALTRRLFNHTEFGLNIPGARLDEARRAYESETDPAKRRVKGAMLAGALFNRATAILTKLVEVQALGVEIQSSNQLMRECGRCLHESLTLGKMVMHRSGDEGIDELWGEPFKAFTLSANEFFEGRYVKIAQAMRDIDQLTAAITAHLGELPAFAAVAPALVTLGESAKTRTETLAADAAIFDVWSAFKVACEQVQAFAPSLAADADLEARYEAERGRGLLQRGVELISDIARARVSMPKSTQEYIEACIGYRASCRHLALCATDAA